MKITHRNLSVAAISALLLFGLPLSASADKVKRSHGVSGGNTLLVHNKQDQHRHKRHWRTHDHWRAHRRHDQRRYRSHGYRWDYRPYAYPSYGWQRPRHDDRLGIGLFYWFD